MTQIDKLDKAIRNLLERGLTYMAEYVKQPNFKYSGVERKMHTMLDWKICLTIGKYDMHVEYHTGLGHIPGYKVPKSIDDVSLLVNIMQTGCFFLNKPLPIPALRDVLFALINDHMVMDYDNFEAWCAEFGYDDDSRKVLATYQACLDNGLKLQKLLGYNTIEELREAFQDY